MNEDLKRLIKALSFLSTIGIAMAISIAMGAFIGYCLDEHFNTRPWFSYIFLGLGIAAAFRSLYVLYKRGKRELEK
jgi:F0F1-type ATP synthase assembly protein I